MSKITDLIRSRNLGLTEDEIDGVKSRLAFAGLDDSLSEQDQVVATNLLDRLVEKMRGSKQNIQDYSEQTSTIPKAEAAQSADGKLVTISLVNGRLATLDVTSNVVTPKKKTA